MAIAQDTTEIGLINTALELSRTNPPSVKTSSRTWPANMLANNRSERVNGRSSSVVKNSIGTSRRYIGQGTPGRNSVYFRYPQKPCLRMPRYRYRTQEITARVAGKAMCEFGETWRNGMIPKTLVTSTKTNNVAR